MMQQPHSDEWWWQNIPDGVSVEVIYWLQVLVQVNICRQGDVCVMGRAEVGHSSTGNAETSSNWKEDVSGQYLWDVHLSHSSIQTTHTCSDHASEGPALAVLHGRAVVFMVFFQDFHTPAPNCRTGSKWIVSWPVSLQDSAVIRRVGLDKWRKFFIYFYVWIPEK